ncbi:MAG: SBBP repeat-containing protein [Anaerolineales bacterium]|nr:SBBP repeat-containing protein [Anaerolineales bacterium]
MPPRFYVPIRYTILVFLLLVIGLMAIPLNATRETFRDERQLFGESVTPIENSASSPIMFIENVGQFDDQARFQVQGAKATMWLADEAIWITLVESSKTGPEQFGFANRAEFEALETEVRQGVNIKLTFEGANPAPQIVPFNRLNTHISYFRGNDPEEWQPDVPVWGGVRYQNLYPGVDLEFSAENGQLAPRLVCKANCEQTLQNVRLRVAGTDRLVLENTHLRLTTIIGEFSFPLLQAVTADGDYPKRSTTPVLAGTELITPFFTTQNISSPSITALVPQENLESLLYSTFLGGSSRDGASDISIDVAGNAYITGYTASSDFPVTAGAFDTTFDNLTDTFVANLSANGAGLVYVTYLGGSDRDFSNALSIDGMENVFISGYTSSSNFPVTANAFDTTYNGNHDAFVVKLSANGTELAYATYLGGSDHDYVWDINIDESGNVFITGETKSNDLPVTVGAFDTTLNSYLDAFVAKLNTDGSELVYATYLGGSSFAFAQGIRIDDAGNAFIIGATGSNDFPVTVGAFDITFNGSWDTFVAKINAIGTELIYATYIGGSNLDYGVTLSLDEVGNVFITGYTSSTDFPVTADAVDTTHNGSYDAFIGKLSANGAELAFATYLGGSSDDHSWDVSIDGAGNSFITGQTSSSDFPVTADAFDTTQNGGDDAFVAKLNANGSELAYATYFGGNSSDVGNALSIDEMGNAFIAGTTGSSDFPVTAGAFDTTYNGGDFDAFVTKLALEPVQQTYSISGEITEFDSIEPISSVSVMLGNPSNPIATTSTGVNGHYSFAELAPGSYLVTPVKEGYAFTPPAETVELSDQDFPGTNFQGEETCVENGRYTISGKVLDPNGNPVPDVNVTATNSSYPLIGGSTMSQQDGSFEIGGLSPCLYHLESEKYGYEMLQAWEVDLINDHEIDLTIAVDMTMDMDEDALPDAWELYGYTHEDGTFVDLPTMGANYLRKDIFVVVFYMVGYQPKQEAMNMVVAAFYSAPVPNPSGQLDGITLHIDSGYDHIMDPVVNVNTGEVTGTIWGDLVEADILFHDENLKILSSEGNIGGEFDEIKNDHFSQARAPIFHYAIFAHFIYAQSVEDLECNSGFSLSAPGSDFIVSLGGWGTAGPDGKECGSESVMHLSGTTPQQAGTFMHELGHNLGLLHGGPVEEIDSIKRKPNHFSVMNYSFQQGLLTGPDFSLSNRQLNYAEFTLDPLNENNLDETTGITPYILVSNFATIHSCDHWLHGRSYQWDTSIESIDWNCDGDELDKGVQYDINADINAPFWENTKEPLNAYSEWDKLIFNGGEIGREINSGEAQDLLDVPNVLSPEIESLIDELTLDEANQLTYPYNVAVVGSNNLMLFPNSQFEMTFTIGNIGTLTDTYDITVSSSSPDWLNTNNIPDHVTLSPEETRELSITVNVPGDISPNMQNNIVFNVISQQDTFVQDTAYTNISVRSENTYLPVILSTHLRIRQQ